MQETRVQSMSWEDPLEKEMATHSSFLAWEIPWQKSLMGYSPWGRKELDMTEYLSIAQPASQNRTLMKALLHCMVWEPVTSE